jgi:LmbE family N-acetylglucosaminyl deacetylase
MRGDGRILILAPHPDDEVVACGVAALRACAASVRVFVLYLTTGVPPRETQWRWRRSAYQVAVQRRRAEARAAAAVLGIEPLRFRETPARRLRGDLASASAEVIGALAICEADSLWVPAFEGAHQDHDAANALAAGFADWLPVWEFAAYHFAHGRTSANEFIDRQPGEMTIAASAWEAQRKHDALRRYASERGNLRQNGVTHEAGRLLPRQDYGMPPHAGRLFRERYHWVPFRHPRVDFDASAEIYRDLGRWASAGAADDVAPLDDRPGDQPGQADCEFAGAFDKPEG